ncbi:MAG: hypothetical protein EB127_10040, partial [Alphaproteobacteria bacterium]|nr:hypothetical protein [Alphaproteobacteria bacterium]
MTKSGKLCLNTVNKLGERCHLHKDQTLTEEQRLQMSRFKTNYRNNIKLKSAEGGYKMALAGLIPIAAAAHRMDRQPTSVREF